MAAMREALVKIEKKARCDLCNVYPKYRDKFNDMIGGIEREAHHALAKPPRNCDVMSLAVARKVWFAKEIVPRLTGDLPLGKEIPFEEWLYAPATEKKGENDGGK